MSPTVSALSAGVPMQRAGMNFTPILSRDEMTTGSQPVAQNRNNNNPSTNIIHDAFMNSTNFFSNSGFASGPRAYAAVAQMNIVSNYDALNNIHLTDLNPCTAWFV